jgi:hypothetical protein
MAGMLNIATGRAKATPLREAPNGTKSGRSKEDVCFAPAIQVMTIHEEKFYR